MIRPVRHHRDGVRQALGLLDVVRATSAPSRRPRAARRSATTAPGAPAGRGPPSARRAAPAAGSWISPRATSSRRRIPPESSLTIVSARGPGWRSRAPAPPPPRRSAARHAVEAREHRQDLPAGQLDVEVVELRHDAHLQARLLGFAAAARSRAPRSRPRRRAPARSASASSSTCPRRSARAGRSRRPPGTSRSRPSTAAIAPKRLTTPRSEIAGARAARRCAALTHPRSLATL